MIRIYTFLFLFSSYCIYSWFVYTTGTHDTFTNKANNSTSVKKGKMLFQQYNCISCHQVYGLGGYIGPELTQAYSDKLRGPLYIKAFLKSGSKMMPDFKLTEDEIESLTEYLHYIDQSTKSVK